MAPVDMSVSTGYGMYSVDIPKCLRGCNSIIQMITLLCSVEISVQYSYLLYHTGEVTFLLWYIKIIQIQIDNCFK